jgi:cystathionine beta-lyase
MDFRTSDAILQVLSDAVQHGVFGYPYLLPQCRTAAAAWLSRRHAYTCAPERIFFTPQVVGGIALAIDCLTRPGDGIVIQPPVYGPLHSIVTDNGRVLHHNPLCFVNNRYSMDLDHLEGLFARGIRHLLFCSPHNPTGRVWTGEELLDLAALCERYGVLVFSDEIHHDLVYSDAKHTVLAGISEAMSKQVITFTAPSKTFNLAGLMTSVAVLPTKSMAEIYAKALRRFAIQVNQFGQAALCAAYTDSDNWLRELLLYLEQNRDTAEAYIRATAPSISMIHPEGTFLYWLNMRQTGLGVDELVKALTEKGKVAVYDGRIFGTGGEGFIRFNGACPRKFMLEGLERICALCRSPGGIRGETASCFLPVSD